MKHHGMIFNGDMVRSILDGRKTQDRRLVKPQPRVVHAIHPDSSLTTNLTFRRGDQRIHSPIRVGDIIWVRETWRVDGIARGMAIRFGDCKTTRDGMSYRADMEGDRSCDDCDWIPSIHMPRWASRIDLEVTAVRVERVQDISETDCEREGVGEAYLEHLDDCESHHCALAGGPDDCCGSLVSAKMQFKDLWQSIYANWDANPWVWVYEFRRVK